MEKIIRKCMDLGLRVTRQRRIIAQVLSEASDHPDVNAIHRRAAALDSSVSIATVYRTLRLFRQSGLLNRHEFSIDSTPRYEDSDGERHDHLIDVQSGAIIEFHSEEIDRLQTDIAARHGYRLVGRRMELYGVRQKESET